MEHTEFNTGKLSSGAWGIRITQLPPYEVILSRFKVFLFKFLLVIVILNMSYIVYLYLIVAKPSYCFYF